MSNATLIGDAGFRWTEGGVASYHYLGGRLRSPTSNPVQSVYTWTSADFTTTRRVSIGTGELFDLRATLPYDGNPQSLAVFLAAARRGAALEYFPSFAAPSLSFPCELVEAGEIQPDGSFWWDRRYTVDVVLRRTDGGTWQALLEAPLFYYQAGNAATGLTFTRTGTANYVDEDGVLQSAATGVERVDWTGGSPALLIERARENLILQSEDIATSWVNVRSTDSTNDTTAPDGATTADTLIEDATASNSHYIYQNVTKAASALEYSLSVFVKALTRSGVSLQIADSTGSNRVEVEFLTLATAEAVATGGTGFTAGVAGSEALGDGWYRVWLTGTTNSDTTVQAKVMLNDGVATSYSGDGTSGLYVWGAQLEEAAGPSSYIATTTVAVTRNADTWYADFAHPPQEMTVYAKFIERGGTVSGPNMGIVHIGAAGNSTDPRFQLQSAVAGGYNVIHDNGVGAQSATAAANPVDGDTVELRGVVNANGSVFLGQSINAAAEVVTSTSAGATLAPAWAGTRLYIGSRGSTNAGLNQQISVKVAAGVKTLAEMRAL